MNVIVYVDEAQRVFSVGPFVDEHQAVAYAVKNGIVSYLVLELKPTDSVDEIGSIFTRRTAVEYVRVGLTKFKELEKEGRIKSLLIGRRRIYRKTDLDAFLDSLDQK